MSDAGGPSGAARGEPDAPRRWMDAVRDGAVRAALEAIYADTARAIEARGPACWASGRCCNFEKAGHRLYVTGLEAAYTLVHAPAERRIDPAMLAEALARGGCPFQIANLCGVHETKPLACRVYFCDRSAQEWQKDLSEAMHERVKALHIAHAIEYRYAEWRSLLGLLLEAGAPAREGGGAGAAATVTVPLRVLPNTDAV